MRDGATRHRPGGVWIFWTILSVGCAASSLRAAPPSPSGAGGFLRSFLVATLPREYEKTRNWGATKPRWDGLRISWEGGKLHTKRRWKEVNHGTWTRYRAELVNPEERLRVQLGQPRSTATQETAIDITVDADLALFGRVSEWRQGVQLYSLSATGEASVTLWLDCTVALSFDTSRFPPDLVLTPRVRDANLSLRQFRLHEISDADGPLVRELGEELQDVLQDELRDERAKLIEKANRSLVKHQDRLRLPWSDALTGGWQPYLPATSSKSPPVAPPSRP